MPIHEFTTDIFVQPLTMMGSPGPGPGQFPIAMKQQSHAQGGRTQILTGKTQSYPGDTEDFLIPGFRSLDESMKMFWSGMRVPTKDSYRFMRVKVAGGDKTLLIWRDDLLNGRVRLPVGSLNRSKESFNKDRFSPAYLSMDIRYPTKRGNLAALVYRPTPWLVEYTLSVWAEHKRDAEHIKFQILNRFNPLAIFHMFDGHLQGDVTIRFGDASDVSDKEATFDQHRMIKYDYTMTAEAWLPLPERVIPTVLGTVVSVRDQLGSLFERVSRNQLIPS